MIRPPFLARVAAGVAVTAYEETLKLPSTAVSLPMTTVSQILQTTMRVQQVMTSFAIKGDQFFEIFGAEPAETAQWATFDDDGSTPSDETATSTNSAPGRFALYSIPPATEADAPVAEQAAPVKAGTATTKGPAKKTAAEKSAPKKAAAKSADAEVTKIGETTDTKVASDDRSEIVEYLDYDSLTLAQLRARLRALSVDELTAVLEYENAHAARTPFVTMLSNRITSARNK
ncbi:lipid droplet-associated protein [Rhodococcus pyridinivorans]|uniref:lipid droplet-associated protein n=1 Tax=Rhodococcus pyridinivorans TaxID=103816 RepID=UPI002078B222|nr:lipid droplet-associated protein [Rhodococcus pyridinivorans]USI91409.1 lipid droplet-associated protein [Rhodococcus pyridinivorans]UTM38303.1 lipid droplet-associated protein [Rhodococcus pyridinivorans]